jgi:hypothetical protein
MDVVVNLYMEEFERTALLTYTGTPPSHWYRYVDDTWVVLRKDETDQFFQHINGIDPHIKFTQERMDNDKLPFLDCHVKLQPDGSLTTTVYSLQEKNPHRSISPFFLSPSLKPKAGGC